MGVKKAISDKATVEVGNSGLVQEGEALVRTATRVPADLRDELKVTAVYMRVSVNQLYGLILREFLTLKVYNTNRFEWKRPKTAPRAAATGGRRGDENWVQVLIMLPAPLLKAATAAAETAGVSVAALCYSAFDWYVDAQQQRAKATQSRSAVAG